MQLKDVQEAMRPAAEMALAKGLTHAQAERAFFLTMITVALEQSGGIQKKAAELLKITPPYLCAILKGKEKKPRVSRRRTSPKFSDRHGAPPAAVIGAMEL